MQSNTIRPLMKSVIREDLVVLTSDYRAAVVLHQLIYWTKRVHDFDKFLQEEHNRNPECNVSFRYGWIIKTAQDLADETMLGLSRQTIRSILKKLIELEVIEESYLGDNKWDKTTKYRLNLVKLQESLFALGYPLNDFTISENLQNSRMLSSQHSRVQIGHSSVNPRPSYVKNLTNNIEKKLHKEIILENSSPISSSLTDVEKKIANDMKNIWIEEIGEIEVTQLDENSILNMIKSYRTIFSSSLDSWRSYCRKIASSKFLMGEGGNKSFQRAWLSWAIRPDIYYDIERGKYTLGDRVIQSPSIEQIQELDYKQELLKLEKHPLWIETSLLLIDRVGEYTFQWLKDLDLNYHDQDIVELRVANRFVRDWIIKNLFNPIKSALELTLKHPIQHLKIETIEELKFGISPVSKVEEGEGLSSSLSSTSLHLSTMSYKNQKGGTLYV